MDALIGWPGGDWQATARLAATLVGGYLFVLWATSVLWVYRDIQSRTRDPVSQLTAVAIAIVFPLVSLPIYAALRPPETLQDAYLRLLEREVLLSELGAIQQEGTTRRPTGGGGPAGRAAAAMPPMEDPFDPGPMQYDPMPEPRLAFEEPPQVSLRPEADLPTVDEFVDGVDAPSPEPMRRRQNFEDEPVRRRG